MFIIVEGGNHWLAEKKFMGELKLEVGKRYSTSIDLEGGQVFLTHIRSKLKLVDLLFVSGILSLIDNRASMSRESREAAYWFTEHRKVEGEHIVLSDIFEVSYVDVRVRKLLTHRIRVAQIDETVVYRVMSLTGARVVRAKLGEKPILEAIRESDKPLTPEELEQREKELEETE